VNRKPLILGISISALLVIVILSGLFLFNKWKGSQASVGQRFPLQRLSYCSSDQVRPCIVSFSLAADGKMLVNFLTAGAFYPDFYLKITQDENNHIYTCQKVNKFATSVYCTGAAMPLGKVLQFSIFSINEDVLLAQGNLTIIGMALGTPEIVSSPTLGTPSTPSPTEFIVLPTPTGVRLTPTRTPTLPPSYPNTSYPNRSYP
jgi:hypothetical protein